MTAEPLPTVALYFRFYGDAFDPDEITRRLGIEPLIHFRPGDPITKDGKGSRQSYGWMVKVDRRETIEIDKMLQELQDRVSVPAVAVKQLCADLRVEAVVVCGVGRHESPTMPTLYFPTDFVEWVAEMGASINVDVVT